MEVACNINWWASESVCRRQARSSSADRKCDLSVLFCCPPNIFKTDTNLSFAACALYSTVGHYAQGNQMPREWRKYSSLGAYWMTDSFPGEVCCYSTIMWLRQQTEQRTQLDRSLFRTSFGIMREGGMGRRAAAEGNVRATKLPPVARRWLTITHKRLWFILIKHFDSTWLSP